jgi:septal ring factor EnvC (AmiA/AmiB activator)
VSDEQLDPLRLVVQHMEEQLDDRVDEVSESKPSRDETTQELIQLEETLSSAQDKAKKLVTLRLKLEDEEATAERAETPAAERAAIPAAERAAIPAPERAETPAAGRADTPMPSAPDDEPAPPTPLR